MRPDKPTIAHFPDVPDLPPPAGPGFPPEEPPELDLVRVRDQFPALASGWVFLDNAGGSQVLATVADRAREYLLSTSVQLGAKYEVSRRAGERVEEAKRAAAALIGADAGEVVLGSSTTQLLANLAQALAQDWQPGDEVVVTSCDHAANLSGWLRLAQRGIVVKTWHLDPGSLELRTEDLAPLLGARTRLVCFTHVSNVLGSVHPVAEIARFVHERGARVCVDGVAYAPHRLVDVRAWDVDFYVFSLYKVFGPHQALLYGKRDLLLGLSSVSHASTPREAVGDKLVPGHLNYELAYGLPAIVDYLAALAPAPSLSPSREAASPALAAPGEVGAAAGTSSVRERLARGFAAIARHEERLVAPLLDLLASRRGVRIFGHPRPDRSRRVATVSFAASGRSSDEFPAALDGHRIGIRSGDFMSKGLVTTLSIAGSEGVVRISMAHYNTEEEVKYLIEKMEALL